MNGAGAAFAAITEILTWAGLGAAAVFGAAALIVKLADGTWLPVRAVIIGDPDAADPSAREVVRWFGEDGVHEAPLTAELRAAAEGDEVTLHHRVGSRDDVRLDAHSPWPRLLGGVALASGGVGLLTLVAQIAAMFAAG
ncbi:hypothetical protein B5M43_011325 [Microbacterium sp. MEC084]|uniref:hypothetical protein n=1 Tax=Microbacterium sp. MEC084 TaxID=1963027 RepID=UPI00106FF445|nr:hypothetical protein [Microbacterium sp. MEC084]MCD1269420.1 hypothetical protein [Microbacterium sp. MEC084]